MFCINCNSQNVSKSDKYIKCCETLKTEPTDTFDQNEFQHIILFSQNQTLSPGFEVNSFEVIVWDKMDKTCHDLHLLYTIFAILFVPVLISIFIFFISFID